MEIAEKQKFANAEEKATRIILRAMLNHFDSLSNLLNQYVSFVVFPQLSTSNSSITTLSKDVKFLICETITIKNTALKRIFSFKKNVRSDLFNEFIQTAIESLYVMSEIQLEKFKPIRTFAIAIEDVLSRNEMSDVFNFAKTKIQIPKFKQKNVLGLKFANFAQTVTNQTIQIKKMMAVPPLTVITYDAIPETEEYFEIEFTKNYFTGFFTIVQKTIPQDVPQSIRDAPNSPARSVFSSEDFSSDDENTNQTETNNVYRPNFQTNVVKTNSPIVIQGSDSEDSSDNNAFRVGSPFSTAESPLSSNEDL